MYEHVSKLTKRYGDRMFAADDGASDSSRTSPTLGQSQRTTATACQFPAADAVAVPCTAGKQQRLLTTTATCERVSCGTSLPLSRLCYDFGALWSAHERETELKSIDGGNACWCTHVCFIHDSMRHSRRALLYDYRRTFFSAKVCNAPMPQTPDGDHKRKLTAKAVWLMPLASLCSYRSQVLLVLVGSSTVVRDNALVPRCGNCLGRQLVFISSCGLVQDY